MSIKPRGVLINSDLYTKTDRDIIYNSMVNYIFSTGVLQKLLEEIINKEEFGENSQYLYDKLDFIRTLVHYLMLMNIELLKAENAEDKQKIKDSYKLACFRHIALCKYHIEEIFDGLVNLSDNTQLDGLDYMILEGYFNNPPFLIP